MTSYVKKTWVSNEVITTAAMNNIETGIDDGFKTSELVGDGTLDMSGNSIVNVSVLEIDDVLDTSANGIAVPSQRLQASLDTEGAYTGQATQAWADGPYFTLTSGFDTSANGFLVSFDPKITVTSKYVNIRVLANGTRIYYEALTDNSYDIPRQIYALGLKQGDVIKIQVQSAAAEARSVTIRNFRLYADFVVKTVGVDGATISGAYS